ncbi:fam-c protein [Plasmodium vinckei brucechwatti]|uniref:Fam-c protein n=1 Tax=Plasmodium vinckei brucechwatti TaxID=119398 RepID=A0A6V7RVY9_PLAVN|nr:fam-c protein [Plasmodium vinckei brucechwatti]
MNKKIFSLVCIVLYVLWAVSIHCSEQKNDRSKTPGLRSRIIRAIKQIKRSSKKNDTESQRETQLNNNNNKENFDDKANFKLLNSEKYRAMQYRHIFCCGFCYDYRGVHGYKTSDG